MRLNTLKVGNANWKYILGEIFLIFVGINLAVWFNNWNASKAISKNKEQAVLKIEGEIQSNLEELQSSWERNGSIPLFIEDFRSLTTDEEDRVLITVAEMQDFKTKYSGFFTPLDSLDVGSNKFAYTYETFINLEIAALSEIAWETSKSTGIFNAFEFDCLYGLESMYNLQGLVKQEYGNALEALQKEDIDKLIRVLVFIDQLDDQLEEKYQEMLQNLNDCK
ncbi:MAG: hypothetical protein AAF717_19885 [Bacteroidota bacterium]